MLKLLKYELFEEFLLLLLTFHSFFNSIAGCRYFEVRKFFALVVWKFLKIPKDFCPKTLILIFLSLAIFVYAQGNFSTGKQWIEGCLRSAKGEKNKFIQRKNWEMKNTRAIKWNLLSGQNPFFAREMKGKLRGINNMRRRKIFHNPLKFFNVRIKKEFRVDAGCASNKRNFYFFSLF